MIGALLEHGPNAAEAMGKRMLLLRRAFQLMRQRPAPADQARLQSQLHWIHQHNVARWGAAAAETMRAISWGEVADELPTGEATESDFTAFLASQCSDPARAAAMAAQDGMDPFDDDGAHL